MSDEAGSAPPAEALAEVSPGLRVAPAFLDRLRAAGLDSAEALLAPDLGETLRSLPDRDNVRLDLTANGESWRLFLKRHRGGKPRRETPAAEEAATATRLAADGVPTLETVAVSERTEPNGTVSSAFVSEDLTGYRQLDELIPDRFAEAPPGDPRLDALVSELGRVAKRFHALGLRHRDFYTCHFFGKEEPGGGWSVRLIDLQRVFEPGRLTSRRYLTKDLGQLLYSRPPTVGCRGTGVFLRAYLGGPALARERRLLAAAKRKADRLRAKHGPYRPGW